VESAIRDWIDGFNNAEGNEFSKEKYGPIYQRHLDKLQLFKQKAPNYTRAWLQRLCHEAEYVFLQVSLSQVFTSVLEIQSGIRWKWLRMMMEWSLQTSTSWL
jgi:hypothetical protein